MINFSTRFMRVSIRPKFSQIAVASALSAIGLFAGVVPQLGQSPTNLLADAAAFAQADPQITSYARAAMDIERLRQKRYGEAKQLMGGNVPGDVCRQQDIPSTVRGICDEFLRESTAIIQKNGLDVRQFNDLTRRKNSDPALQQQIQSELLRLQKAAP